MEWIGSSVICAHSAVIASGDALATGISRQGGYGVTVFASNAIEAGGAG